ncbi:hypothetical protein T492DRAFT_836543 [Pavlovales sp. CCMP2436]|nr:hypothetical protein T492DRAFT_836543 [Pavlovales sp. CCMP2436]
MLPVECIRVLQLFVCALGMPAALAAKHAKTAEHVISLYGLALALDVRPLVLASTERCEKLLHCCSLSQLLQIVDATAEHVPGGESLNRKAMAMLTPCGKALLMFERDLAQIVDGAAGLSFTGIASFVSYLPDDLLEGSPPVVSPALIVPFIKPAGAAELPCVQWHSGSDSSGAALLWQATPAYTDAGHLSHLGIKTASLFEGRVHCTHSATVTNPTEPSKAKAIGQVGMLVEKGDHFGSFGFGALDTDGLVGKNGMVRIEVSVHQPRSTLQLDALSAWVGVQLGGRVLTASVHEPVELCALVAHLEAALGGATAAGFTVAASSHRVANVKFDAVIQRHLVLQFEEIAGCAGLLDTLPLSLLLRLLLTSPMNGAQLALVQMAVHQHVVGFVVEKQPWRQQADKRRRLGPVDGNAQSHAGVGPAASDDLKADAHACAAVDQHALALAIYPSWL